jgi:hypothetical protein
VDADWSGLSLTVQAVIVSAMAGGTHIHYNWQQKMQEATMQQVLCLSGRQSAGALML